MPFGVLPAMHAVAVHFVDVLVHGWDLAVATGGDPRLDPALVDEVATWFAERDELYRQAGAIGARVEGGDGPQARLLGGFGRDSEWSTG